MTIIGGFDIHRAQLTFDYLDTETGEIRVGQIHPATRETLRAWLAERFSGRKDVILALEGCTGWRFVVEELQRAGIEPHLAEPAETSFRSRGPKQRAKTDRIDARKLRELLTDKRLPESWIPPQYVQEVRALGRLYGSLMDERRAWLQRIQAQLYHQGVPAISNLLTLQGRIALRRAQLSPVGCQVIETALQMIAALDQRIGPLRGQLQALGRCLPGARALKEAHFGIGYLCAVVIWAEMGDCRRFRRSGQVVRLAGLDVTVYSSDGKRSAGHLARQGSPMLRWALYEASKAAARKSSSDHEYYETVRGRCGGKRPAISMARKLARRCYHTLRDLGEEALALPANLQQQAA